jgi:hypothetical protein
VSKFLVVAYFIVLMLPVIILIPFIIFGLYGDMKYIIYNEISKENIGFIFIMLICLLFSFPMLIPYFRFIFKKLPWLYAYITLALLDIFLISIGISILNYGYEIKNANRHFLFFIFMIAWMVIGRLSICLYYKFKPIKYEGDENNV